MTEPRQEVVRYWWNIAEESLASAQREKEITWHLVRLNAHMLNHN